MSNICEDELHIDRSHIGCDCCGKPGPTKNCSRCMSYYYCNRECQLNHWSKHKDLCSILKDKCDSYNNKKRIVVEFLEEKEKGRLDDEASECAICLQEIELSPMSLECGHTFCAHCLLQYQATNKGKGSCPNCRGFIDNEDFKQAGQHMPVYIERAKRSHGAEKEMYINLALRHIDATLSIRRSFYDDHPDDLCPVKIQLFSLVKKASVFGRLGMHLEVIETVDKFMNLSDELNCEVDKEIILDVSVEKAGAHLELKEWQTALEMYRLLQKDCKDRYRKYFPVILAGFSRAKYELHKYHEAAVNGSRAASLIRHRTGVHKYIALSQMKMGDFAGAKKSISVGILHEEQWNIENKKENEEVLRMILAEEAQNAKPKSKKKGKKKKCKP